MLAMEVAQLAPWMPVFADQLSPAIPLSAAVAGKQRLQALNRGHGICWLGRA
ncbi:MAG: Uncharacterised protein [Prochlorococcus marinus str. MIT 9215]|nr:MAG: Uncharacterised protein [Prochlorococcus marinus str. MIT 9215]